MAAFHALNDAPLAARRRRPPRSFRVDARAALRPEGLKETRSAAGRGRHVAGTRPGAAHGQGPRRAGLRLASRWPPPTTAELPPTSSRRRPEAERQQWAVVEDAVGHAERALELLKKGKVDPAQLVHRGPPAYRAEYRTGRGAGLQRAGKPWMRPAAAVRHDVPRAGGAAPRPTCRTFHHQPPVRRLVGRGGGVVVPRCNGCFDRRIAQLAGHRDLTGPICLVST